MHDRPLTGLVVSAVLVMCAAPAGAMEPGATGDGGAGEGRTGESADSPARISVPEIRARDIDGKDLSLHDLLARGPVLLNFWALWCRPCLKELPELDRLQKKYADRGFTVIAVNTDTPVDVGKVKPFARSRRFSLRVITDLDGDLRRRFQINAFPTAILLAPDGTTVWSNQGYRPGDEKALEEELLKRLAVRDGGGRAPLPDETGGSDGPPPAPDENRR